jgi:hypothetical protein
MWEAGAHGRPRVDYPRFPTRGHLVWEHALRALRRADRMVEPAVLPDDAPEAACRQ